VPAGLAAAIAVLGVATLAFLWAWLDYQANRGLLVGYTTTIGAMLRWVHDHTPELHFHHLFVHIDFVPGHIFGDLNRKLYGWIQTRVEAAERDYALSTEALAAAWSGTVYAVEWTAHELASGFDWLLNVKLPKWARWAALAALPAALLAKLIQQAIAHIRPLIVKTTKVIYRDIPRTVPQIIRLTAPAVLPGALGIPRIWDAIHGLTKRNLRISRRLHRVEGLFGAAVMAAAMANALGLGKNWRCITRGNIGRAARHLCGLDKWALDFLLLGSVEAFIATDLCEFTHLLSEATKLQVPALMELVSVEDALIGCHGAEKPLQFKLPTASLPPLQGVSPLAA